MTDGRTTLALPASLARVLDGVRRRYLAVRVAEFPVLLIGFVSLAWLAQATVDRWLELSWNARAVLLSLDAIGAILLLWFFAIAPLRQRLNRKKAALLVERTLPRFKTSLVSAVEFAAGEASYPAGSRPLVEKLLQDVAEEAAKDDVVRQVVSAGRLKKITKWAIAAVVIAVGCAAFAHAVSPILVKRILLSHVALPDDTKVISVTADMTVIAGTEAILTAKAEGEIPPSGRLVISYEGKEGETIPVSPVRTQEGVFQYSVRNIREPFRYRFELNDGIGAQHTVGVRVPPSLQSIRFVQIYPKHTGLPETEMSPASLRLLAGSKLRIEAVGSEAIQSAILEIKGAEEMVSLKIAGDKSDQILAEMTVPDRGWKSMAIHLTAASGEVSVNDPVYRVDLVNDRPPVVVLTQPKKDAITVVEGATVPFIFRVSDDFGLKRVALSYRIFRPGINGEMQAAEEAELQIKYEPGEKAFARTLDWELSRLLPAVGVGCSISCWIEAEDNSPNKGAATTRSAEKVIKIVSEEQKRMELLDLLGERAKDIERLYELQRGMNEKTDESIR